MYHVARDIADERQQRGGITQETGTVTREQHLLVGVAIVNLADLLHTACHQRFLLYFGDVPSGVLGEVVEQADEAQRNGDIASPQGLTILLQCLFKPFCGLEQLAEALAVLLAVGQQMGDGVDVYLFFGFCKAFAEPQFLEEVFRKRWVAAAEHGCGILQVVAQLFLRDAPVHFVRHEVIL